MVSCLLVASSGCAAGRGRFADKDWRAQTKTTPKSTLLPTLETRDPALASALLRLALAETAEHHRLVAAAYRRAGVTDYAHRHYQRALGLEPCDSLAFEGLAQIWRDWFRPDLALGDAHRAVHCRPESAAAHNTLGTVLQALGQTKNARREFERAVELDERAAFALNNLCYLSLHEGDGRAAEALCERALVQDPALPAARTNLALAYVMRGDIAGAEGRLLEDPDRAAGLYNVGMLRMALGWYAPAAEAFEAAAIQRPSSADARRRASQARGKAVAERE
jgi:Flp pilus assembly protein TadD